MDYTKISNIGDRIMIKELQEKLTRVEPEDNKNACIFCGSDHSTIRYMGKLFCQECYRELQQAKRSLEEDKNNV
ncbi:MAG: hypothetical protein ACOCQC_01425 [Halanaerobiaceae bacterium]